MPSVKNKSIRFIEMKETVKKVSAWMASHSSTYVIAAAVLAFLLPEAFGWVRGDVSSVILGCLE